MKIHCHGPIAANFHKRFSFRATLYNTRNINDSASTFGRDARSLRLRSRRFGTKFTRSCENLFLRWRDKMTKHEPRRRKKGKLSDRMKFSRLASRKKAFSVDDRSLEYSLCRLSAMALYMFPGRTRKKDTWHSRQKDNCNVSTKISILGIIPFVRSFEALFWNYNRKF